MNLGFLKNKQNDKGGLSERVIFMNLWSIIGLSISLKFENQLIIWQMVELLWFKVEAIKTL